MAKDKDILKTEIWELYERSVNYKRTKQMYTDDDDSYRMYNGNQWKAADLGGFEPIQLNIIKPIVKYKVGTINANLWAINYSAENFEEQAFLVQATKACDILNRHVRRILEKDGMDYKVRKMSKQAGIVGEGVIYVDFKDNNPSNEVLNRGDVSYGNENNSEIQPQPYILLSPRKPIEEIMDLARKAGVTEEEIAKIASDKETTEQTGDDSKTELNDMAVLLTMMYKKDGTVWIKQGTRQVSFGEPRDTKCTLYPISHFIWEEVEGSARGIGEVKYLIPNQYEINKTIMRRSLAVRLGAYPKIVYDDTKIGNPEDIDKIGVKIRSKGSAVDDVRKILNSTTPSTMSSDSKELQTELITLTRELNGAGDAVAGDLDPTKASGKAILAVQQAAQQPLTEQTMGLKNCIEDLARIYFDQWKTYLPATGLATTEEIEQVNPKTQQKEMIEQPYTIPKTVLEALKTSSKVDVTPKSAYDKYAVELTVENLVQSAIFKDTQALEEYVDLLEDDSTMPKLKIKKLVEKRKAAQKEIAALQKQAEDLKNSFNNVVSAQEEQDNVAAQPTQQVEQPITDPYQGQ